MSSVSVGFCSFQPIRQSYAKDLKKIKCSHKHKHTIVLISNCLTAPSVPFELLNSNVPSKRLNPPDNVLLLIVVNSKIRQKEWDECLAEILFVHQRALNGIQIWVANFEVQRRVLFLKKSVCFSNFVNQRFDYCVTNPNAQLDLVKLQILLLQLVNFNNLKKRLK